MTDLIDVMPGIELPVGAVSEELSKMWEGNQETALSEFRASQMNLVLHFGRTVSPNEAKARFEVAVRFAQRYPSRIIVLCPFTEKSTDAGQIIQSMFYRRLSPRNVLL